MTIPAQCLTVRQRAEAEHVSKDQIGKIFSIKAVGWKKSTPIVEFKPVREVAKEAGNGNSPSVTATEMKKSPVKLTGKKESGAYDPLDSIHFNAPLSSSNHKGTNSDEYPSTDHFHKQVVNTNASIGSLVPKEPSAPFSLVRNKSLDQEIIDEPKANTSVGPYPEIISTVQPASNGPCISEIDGLNLDIGRVQKVYVIHYESPASFYVTPSLEELQKFQK